jgi:hypothetical protein
MSTEKVVPKQDWIAHDWLLLKAKGLGIHGGRFSGVADMVPAEAPALSACTFTVTTRTNRWIISTYWASRATTGNPVQC